MASLRYLRSTAIGFSVVALLAPTLAHAVVISCPGGEEFPFLTDDEFQCQRVSFNATLDYFNSFISAREDCFQEMLSGQVAPNSLNCLADVTGEGPGTTGDEDIDRRLRAAEAQMTSAILGKCTNVALDHLGFPGFCHDATPNDPYNAFDHLECLLDRAKRIGTFIIDTEHPPIPPHLSGAEASCADQIARLSASMTSNEFEARGHCLVLQAKRDIDLPPTIDCRRERDPQDPQTGRTDTDEAIVAAHNNILRGIANTCPGIDPEALGFPWRCDFPDNDSVFPLHELVQCMFDFHHRDIFRFLDVIFPCSTHCGNGVLNVEEQCDDGDNDWMKGDFCREDCSKVDCGDTDDDGDVDIVDALYILRAAVNLESCTLLVCDLTGDLKVRVSDALRALQHSVGLPVVLNCPDVSVTCGNGFLETKETCDDGDALFSKGDFCNAACLLVGCGDTDDSGDVTIVDAQYILNASVGNLPCDKSVCDMTGNGVINSTDALRALLHAVGLPIDFDCPAPPPTPPAPPIE